MIVKISVDLQYAENFNISDQYKQKFLQNTLTSDTSKFQEPKYRIYVNSDLLTERSIYWDYTSRYVRENLVIALDPGIHQLKIELFQGKGELTAENIKFHNDVASEFTYIDKTTIEFNLT